MFKKVKIYALFIKPKTFLLKAALLFDSLTRLGTLFHSLTICLKSLYLKQDPVCHFPLSYDICFTAMLSTILCQNKCSFNNKLNGSRNITVKIQTNEKASIF